MPKTTIRGGEKLKRFLREAKRARGEAIRQVDVGFFETARYPPVRTGKRGGQPQKPIPVAAVAAWNEFGTRAGGWGGGTPERPFFRQALAAALPEVRTIVKENIDPKTMAPSRRLGGLVGAAVQGHVQRSINTLKQPPNAPATIAIKTGGEGGRTTPLIDTGLMHQSVTWRIDDPTAE